MVNVFSGGIHATGTANGYQQVMVIPRTGGVVSDIDAACRVWAAAAAIAVRRFGEPRLSASSGIVVPLDSAGQLRLLAQAIAETGWLMTYWSGWTSPPSTCVTATGNTSALACSPPPNWPRGCTSQSA